MTEDQIRELLREMDREPIPLESAARVRLAVARRIEQQSRVRSVGARWRVAAATLAIAAVLIAVAVRPLKQPVSESPGPAPGPEPAASAPVAAPPSEAPVRPPSPSPHPGAESVRRQAKSPAVDNLVLRIETPDPDVVILLVGESAGF